MEMYIIRYTVGKSLHKTKTHYELIKAVSIEDAQQQLQRRIKDSPSGLLFVQDVQQNSTTWLLISEIQQTKVFEYDESKNIEDNLWQVAFA